MHTLAKGIHEIARLFIALPLHDHLLLGWMLLFILVAAPRLGMWVYSLIALPGTCMHELMHWGTSTVLGAQPSFPGIIPKRDGNSWRLGSVTCSPNILTTIPIALAPLALLPAAILYAVFVMSPATGWWYVFHVWVASSMLAASLPSRQDWRVALPALIGALVLFLLLRKMGVV